MVVNGEHELLKETIPRILQTWWSY